MKLCSIPGCTRPFQARGFCTTHYARWRKDNLDKIARSPEARFLAKVTKTETCWLWTGGMGREGYGRFKTGGRMCPQGHEYNEANTYLTPAGRRDCRACRAEAGRRCRARKKVAA